MIWTFDQGLGFFVHFPDFLSVPEPKAGQVPNTPGGLFHEISQKILERSELADIDGHSGVFGFGNTR